MRVGDVVMISAIILASGYSRRMGMNKLLLKYRGKSLIEHTVDIILQCKFSNVILVGRAEEIIEIGNIKGLVVIKNENAVKGISESIKLGVRHCTEANGYMFFTADLPFLDVDTIRLLMHEFRGNPNNIIVPICGGIRKNPVIFPCNLRDDLLRLEGDVGGKKIINENLERVRFVQLQDDVKLYDIDTKENYEYVLGLEENNEYV